MGQVAHVVTSVPEDLISPPNSEEKGRFRFQSLILTEPESVGARRGATVALSMALHGFFLVLVVVLPLVLWEGPLPTPEDSVRAFFVTPSDLAPPPPPPPPPPAGPRAPVRPAMAERPVDPGRFTAPVLVPDRVEPEPGLDFGIEGGVPGGVEGGVPGGVVGGIVGGLPSEAPPPPTQVVRVGGNIKEPKVLHRVEPEYPLLAIQARLAALVILEARIDTRGHVVAVNVLRGHPIFDETAVAALKQWRYQPLLLNGQPTEFILSVTMNFSILQSKK